AVKVMIGRWGIDREIDNYTSLVLWLIPLATILIPAEKEDKKWAGLAGVMYIFVLGYSFFSAMNFFTPRYLLCATFIISCGLSLMIWHIRPGFIWLKAVVSSILILILSANLY